MSHIIKHLSKDPVLKKLIITFPDVLNEWENLQNEKRDIFVAIARTIVNQQLSVKAAATIWGRVSELVGELSPENILKHDREEYRSAGMSYAKSDYLISLANDVVDNTFKTSILHDLSNEEVEKELTKLKGIGPWSAEMIMMFTLHRPDVFSIGDMGLKNAVSTLYNVDKNNEEEIIAISQKWSPYRTIACMYLWKSLDNTPS